MRERERENHLSSLVLPQAEQYVKRTKMWSRNKEQGTLLNWMVLLAHRLNLISSTNEAVMAQQHLELTNITDWEYVLESTSLQENFDDIPRKDWVGQVST